LKRYLTKLKHNCVEGARQAQYAFANALHKTNREILLAARATADHKFCSGIARKTASSVGWICATQWMAYHALRQVITEDMVINEVLSPDGRSVVALHAGFNPHGLVVVDSQTDEVVQRIPLNTAWVGMAWSPDGKRLYVSGGNANGKKTQIRAPIYVFGYRDGRLSEKPETVLQETIELDQIYWSGLIHHPKKGR
jgi:hypothetical protein